MIEYILGFGVLGVLGMAYLLYGAQNNRLKKMEEELEDWTGVMDVKREVDNQLTDPDERKRVRDKYNP